MSRFLQHVVGVSKDTAQTALLGISAVLDPVIGRDDEIDRVICILCRRTKNCAALVGAAGVGKAAVAEGLALRIAAGDVPDALAGARVAELDVGAMVAGTRWRGMFEQRLKDAIAQAEDSDGKLILFIDEMHMIVGAGDRGGTGDAANILKPALARGRIRCVGATTSQEYRKHIEKDSALERRFQKVDVDEPSVEATIAILHGLKKRYQKHHGLTIDDDALVAAVRLADRYITGRQFPDKAIDLMDEACTAVEECFKHELINKLSEIVMFEPLSHDELREIVRIQMKGVIATVADKGVFLFASDAALDVICSKSHNDVYGARPIKRWMEKNVTTVLADMLVNGEACRGSTISIDAADDKRGLKYQVMTKQEVIDPLGI
ncbi:hypothetical protein QYE76_001593 [Lolium multiflorum]|uniref:Uncharacterized protein n=1 Tax=Lolium multiflorum TaxID=4521 RepID=A0AAD8RLN4_LOLMU|nr:hypothetical protein QYE76_001593 [Lolium multiflorum]